MNSLSSNKVGDEGAIAISSALERMTRLITLEYVSWLDVSPMCITNDICMHSLSVNEIGDGGVEAFSTSLNTLSSLRTLRYVLASQYSSMIKGK